MTIPSHNNLAELLFLIQKQIDSQETLSEYLAQAEALAHIAIDEDFLDHPELVVHYFLLTLNNIVVKAKQLNEMTLGFLLKNIPGPAARNAATMNAC